MHDALGTARVQTDDGGSVVGTADYDVYGNLRASSGTQTTEGWAGETRDGTTGLTYLRARDYDPLTGRFMTADTESPNGSLTQGFNPYHYTGNNPVSRTDPSGHNWLDVALGVVNQASQVIVNMVYNLRDVMRSDALPPWAKKFIGVLVIFGIIMMTMLIQILLINVIGAATGATRLWIGGAIFLARIRVAFQMSSLFARCIGTRLCAVIGLWLTRNPDCAGEAGQSAATNYQTGVGGMFTRMGLVGLFADVGTIAIECIDSDPNDNTPQRLPGTRGPPKGSLRANMLAEGLPPDLSYQAHHIVAKGESYQSAQQARQILEQYGIDLNSTDNGVWLPANGSSPNPTRSTVHSSLNTHKYNDDVLISLQKANSAEEVRAILKEWKSLLESGQYSP